jgi:murein L,D-transpeptidase YafK
MALLIPILSGLAMPGHAADFCDRYLQAKTPRGKLVVYSKAQQRLCYFSGGEVAFSHRASHGRNDGPKECHGDGKTPEGRYSLSKARKSGLDLFKQLEKRAPQAAKETFEKLRKKNGKVSLWPTFMPIGYPDRRQKRRARTACRNRNAGSAIGIHGSAFIYKWLGEAQSLVNHSDGCIVLDRAGMNRFEKLIKRRTPILILPDD